MASDSMDWGRRIALARRKRSAWWISVHYSAERFAALLIISTVVIAVTVGLVMRDSRIKRDNVFANTSIYIESATSSASQQRMNVESLHVSSEKNKAFLLLKWNDDDVDNVALSADNYSVLLGARSPSMPAGSRPSAVWSGGVVVYGVTGYVGILLMCQEQFPMEVLDIQLLIDEVVHDDENKTDSEWGYDASGKDQLIFRINPAVPKIKTLESLSSDTPNFYEIYRETTLDPLDNELRTNAENTLTEMKEDLQKIDEQERRLQSITYSGISVDAPARSEEIGGDEVSCTDENTCELNTNYVIGNAWNFDWRSMSLNGGGYVDDECANGSVGTIEYMECVNEKYNIASDTEMAEEKWQYSNGETLTFNDNSQDDYGAALEKTAQKVHEARLKYFDAKKKYQLGIMYDFLELTQRSVVVKDNYTVHADAIEMMGVQ